MPWREDGGPSDDGDLVLQVLRVVAHDSGCRIGMQDDLHEMPSDGIGPESPQGVQNVGGEPEGGTMADGRMQEVQGSPRH